jgi:hypothetical protein
VRALGTKGRPRGTRRRRTTQVRSKRGERIEARHPQVADLHGMRVVVRAEGLRVQWAIKPERASWRDAREGAYLLRANLSDENCAGAVAAAHAVDRSRGCLPSVEERVVHSAVVSSTRAARESARAGGISRLCHVGHTQAPGPKTDELRLRDERNPEMKGARCFWILSSDHRALKPSES